MLSMEAMLNRRCTEIHTKTIRLVKEWQLLAGFGGKPHIKFNEISLISLPLGAADGQINLVPPRVIGHKLPAENSSALARL